MINMKYIRSISYILLTSILLNLQVLASNDALFNYDHRPAVGEVVNRGGSGTATLIEGNILVSAAHVFEEYFPGRGQVAQRSGPVLIDLKNKGVYWDYAKEANGRRISIPVLSMVVDAAYLHSGRSRHGVGEEAERNDIVFLTLDRRAMPRNIPFIPMINQIQHLPQMCAILGYGRQTGQEEPRPAEDGVRKDYKWTTYEGRHADKPEYKQKDRGHIIHRLDLPHSLKDYDVLRMDFRNNVPRDRNAAAGEIRKLLHNPAVDIYRVFRSDLLEAVPGDSGGPLYIVTPEGPRIIGIVSNCDEHQYNGFASLMCGNVQKGFSLSPHVRAMLNHIKGLPADAPLPKQPSPDKANKLPDGFDGEFYVKLHGDLVKAYKTSGMTLEEYGRWHYLMYGKNEGRAYSNALPKGFNGVVYVRMHADLVEAQAKSVMTEEEFGCWHYRAYGQKEGRSYSYALPADFNGAAYVRMHKDLEAAYRKSDMTRGEFGRWHYLTYGKKEGRRYK